MKDAILQQYQGIKDTISSNVKTIRQLIRQAESLKEIAATIGDPATKADMEKHIAEVGTTITILIHQTDELFDQYQKFVEKVFANK